MKLKLSAAVLALGTINSNSDAFLSVTTKTRTATTTGTGSITIQSMTENSNNDDEAAASEDGGSVRFREMMKAAKQNGSTDADRQPTKAIVNPFLNHATSTSTQTQPPMNPDNLSVEDQARMFRAMMAGNQQSTPSVDSPLVPSPAKISRTDRAGRPVGRNRDADMIANTSDLYFAQLKRDSTVRTLGRIRGEKDISEGVFEDEGIDELGGLLLQNPHLQGHRDKELAMYDKVPDVLMQPYLGDDSKTIKAQASISYKQKLMERKNKLQGGTSPKVPSITQEPKENEAVDKISSEPPKLDIAKNKIDVTSPRLPEPEQPVVPQIDISTQTSQLQQQQQREPSIPSVMTIEATAPTNPEEIRQKIRTLMGLMLKHRGGPGFGKGRLKGQEIDRFEGLLEEVTTLLREESELAPPLEKPAKSQSVLEPSSSESSDNSIESANIDSTIACIEGAIAMYKNSPPAIQQSVLVTLRAALVSAVDTCNIVLASQPPPSIAASTDSRIEGVIACIDGAIAMYKNSPPQLKESVLSTLRAAFISAVETCNIVLGQDQLAPPPPPPPPPPPIVSQATATDSNSKALEEIYEKIELASGDGRLGLRSDLTAGEATDLADQLVNMRSVLMEEMDSGIPQDSDPVNVETSAESWDNAISQESSASSRYQEMLAKARAGKS